MKITIDPEYNFDCPEGAFEAVFYQEKQIVKASNGTEQQFLRLLFEIPQLRSETKIVLVARNFVPSLERGSDLKNFLESWLGEDFLTNTASGRQFDSATLIKRPAVVSIRHIANKGYPKPYVYLEQIYPAGTRIEPNSPQVVAPKTKTGTS